MSSKQYVVLQEGGCLAIRTCPEMPMVGKSFGSKEAYEKENEYRKGANAKAAKAFKDLVKAGQAVPLKGDPRELQDKLDSLTLKDGELVERPKSQEQVVQELRAQRREEYPPIGDQLDAIMKWLVTETEFKVPAELKSLAGKCMSVKSKYPMPK